MAANKILDQIVDEDEPAEFSCKLNSSTATISNVKWILNGKVLQNDNNVKISLDDGISKLRIEKCQLVDSGEIACLIGDQKKKTAKLIVEGKL